MGPPGGGRNHISGRLQSRFNLINMTFPNVNSAHYFLLSFSISFFYLYVLYYAVIKKSRIWYIQYNLISLELHLDNKQFLLNGQTSNSSSLLAWFCYLQDT